MGRKWPDGKRRFPKALQQKNSLTLLEISHKQRAMLSGNNYLTMSSKHHPVNIDQPCRPNGEQTLLDNREYIELRTAERSGVWPVTVIQCAL